MRTYQAIEAEVAYRRGEWEREAAMDSRIAQARPKNGRASWQGTWRLVLARLSARPAPRWPLMSPLQTTAEMRRVPTPLSMPEDAPI